MKEGILGIKNGRGEGLNSEALRCFCLHLQRSQQLIVIIEISREEFPDPLQFVAQLTKKARTAFANENLDICLPATRGQERPKDLDIVGLGTVASDLLY